MTYNVFGGMLNLAQSINHVVSKFHIVFVAAWLTGNLRWQDRNVSILLSSFIWYKTSVFLCHVALWKAAFLGILLDNFASCLWLVCWVVLWLW